MKKFLFCTALAGLLAAGSALAQDDHHDRGRGRGRDAAPPQAAPAQAAPPQAMRGPGSGMRRDDRRAAAPAPAAAAPAAAAPVAAAPPAGRGDDRRFSGPRPGFNGPNPGAPASRPDNRGNFRPDNRGNPNPGFNRNAGPRPDFNAWHRNFSAPRRFHAPTIYRRPSGWYAHRWVFGEVLPSLFWASDYWINDFYDFGLAPPPPGTVWVRDGDDALLIDRFSGEIIQVAYGVFF